MTTVLITDTETTGFVRSGPSDHPDQPHLAQLAAKQVDLETRKVIQSMNFIVFPSGWTIPQDAIDCHGIDNKKAAQFGHLETDVTSAFFKMCMSSDQFVAHNVNFDKRILRIAIMRYKGRDLAHWFKEMPSICTMQAARKVKEFEGYSLSASYKHFTGNDLEGAHDAMVDVEGCEQVLYGLYDKGYL